MPWEIPIYICSRFAEALEQIYIPVGLFKQPPPLSLEKEICVWISCIHTNIVYIVYTYGYSIKTPPGGFRWKIEIFSSKIFLTKVLFLETNARRNGSYNHDDYVIAREKAYEDSTSVTFDIREWNTGKVVWKR